MQERLKALRSVVIDHLGRDEQLAVNEGDAHDEEFLRALLPLLAEPVRPNRAIGMRLEVWCTALKRGEFAGLSFDERDEARIGAACLAARDARVAHLTHITRVDEPWNAFIVACSRRTPVSA